MYNGRSGGEELSLFNLESGDLLGSLGGSFEVPFVPFVQLFLLVADDRVAFRDLRLETRDGSRVVIAGSGTEGGDLFLQGGSVSVHVPQVEHPVFRVLADMRGQLCCSVGVRGRFRAGSHRVGDDRLMGRSYVMSRAGQAGRAMTVYSG